MQQWWADQEAVLYPAEQVPKIIEWLGYQTPDTWHQIVLTWNYDFSLEVLAWILEQENCDRGTAARVFLVEGVGYWIWDALDDEARAMDETHVCNIVLRNWKRYKTSELKHGYDVPKKIIELVSNKSFTGHLAKSPVKEILDYDGKREANSKYASEDGKIVIDFDFWVKSKGIELMN
ncbi:conserved hypothetical protein [Roseibium sp. TrichSKD4]|nr:conserved hypothetical protein [Roseibium sp. TrichSKD4]